MSAINAFTDFYVDTTGPNIFSGVKDIISDARLQNYGLLDGLMGQRRGVQGGNKIQDVVLLDQSSQAKNYQPGESANIANEQNSSTISADWRFSRVSITWTEAEILLNGGGSSVSRSAMFHQFKDLKNLKKKDGLTAMLDLVEKNFAASAANQQSEMEATGGKKPYSIFAGVTSDGLAPTGWTTVHGQNPTTKTNWRNPTESYVAATPFDDTDGILAGFDQLVLEMNFRGAPTFQQFNDVTENRNRVVYTNREGLAKYVQSLRAANDITRAGPQDPAFPGPVYDNIPIIDVAAFDELSTFTAGSPDYLFIDKNHVKMVVHQEKFFKQMEPLRDRQTPDTVTVWVDLYYNFIFNSRKRQGYLSAA